MQKTQPTAQPTCVETHTPSRGNSTLSTESAAGKRDKQPRRTIVTGVLGSDSREASQHRLELRQRCAQSARERRVLASGEGIERSTLRPGAQGQRLVPRACPGGAQFVDDSCDVHTAGDAISGRRAWGISTLRVVSVNRP